MSAAMLAARGRLDTSVTTIQAVIAL